MTFVDDIFSGEIRSTVVCCNCGTVSCSHEPFLDLSLPIPRLKPWGKGRGSAGQSGPRQNGPQPSGDSTSAGGVADALSGSVADAVLAMLPADLSAAHEQLRLSACLQAFGAPEALVGTDAYACDKCAAAEPPTSATAASTSEKSPERRGQPALKFLQVARTPRALTLHLKRFRTVGRRVHKLDAHVPFGATLDLSPFACSTGEPVTHYSEWKGSAGGARASRLRLYGVVEHQGTFEGGHYVAFVRLGGSWYQMNDSVVTRVEEADVFKAQAFLLFYERMD